MVSSVQTRTHVARLPSRIHLLFWCTAIPAHGSRSSYVCARASLCAGRRWLRSLNLQVVERTSKGVGYGLPADLQHVDARHGGRVVPGYPLRDTEAKEVATYCRLTGFPTTFFPTFATKQDPRTSIAQVSQGVCSAVCACAALVHDAVYFAGLVAQLQSEFPSTIHNILRTMLKLRAPPSLPGDTPAPAICPLCSSYVCTKCAHRARTWRDRVVHSLIAPSTQDASRAGGRLQHYVCRSCQRVLLDMDMGEPLDTVEIGASDDAGDTAAAGAGGGAGAGAGLDAGVPVRGLTPAQVANLRGELKLFPSMLVETTAERMRRMR